jgi:hypothetical protein
MPHREFLEAARAEKSDITLQALCDRLLAERGVKADTSMMSRFFQRIGVTFKKGSDADLMKSASDKTDDSGLREVELSAPVHLAFDELQFADLPSGLTLDQGAEIAAATASLFFAIPLAKAATRLGFARPIQTSRSARPFDE